MLQPRVRLSGKDPGNTSSYISSKMSNIINSKASLLEAGNTSDASLAHVEQLQAHETYQYHACVEPRGPLMGQERKLNREPVRGEL